LWRELRLVRVTNNSSATDDGGERVASMIGYSVVSKGGRQLLPGPGLIVTDEDLRNEALDLIDTQTVIEIMESYGYDPDDTSGADMNSAWNAVFHNKYGLMANPTTDLHNLFKGFDSHWHNEQQNQKPVTYIGCSFPRPLACIGTEVNYYFQGVLFRIFGYSTTTAMTWIAAWKKGSGHGDVSPNIEFFFQERMG
jgi:hypothetical protein